MLRIIMFLFILMACDSKSTSCSDSLQLQGRIKYGELIYESQNPYGKYEYITIDGMRCIRWNGYSRGGLTCNWNEYKGQK